MTIKAHYDGKVLVPDEPVDLPINCPLELKVQPLSAAQRSERPLARLAELAQQFPVSPDTPSDLAAQHDHYLYGLPKRP